MTVSEVTFRAAQAADAPILAGAERAIAATPGLLVSQPSELSDARFVQKIETLAQADNGIYLVAEIEGRIVGHGLLDPLPMQAVRHVVHLTLAVHPGWQGRGLGSALLGRLIDWARGSASVEKIELHVRSSNARAQALYRRMGFREVGRWKRRVKVGPDLYLDDVAMELQVLRRLLLSRPCTLVPMDWAAKLRRTIAEFPETSEKLSHGSPTWWGGKKTFATFHDGHYDPDGLPAVWIKAPDGVQQMLVASDPDRFYRPKYLGPKGWVGVRLDEGLDWNEVRELLIGGYRTVAPKRALKAMGLEE